MQQRLESMAMFERRMLSYGERAICAAMFGAEIDARRVRLVQLPPLTFGAVVPHGRTIFFSAWRAPRDFAAVGIAQQGWLVHELTHVWQAARGVVLARAKLEAMGRRAYGYQLTPGKPYAGFNIEQQAEIARHLFLGRNGYRAEGAPDLGRLEAIWPIRPSIPGAPVIV